MHRVVPRLSLCVCVCVRVYLGVNIGVSIGFRVQGLRLRDD